MAEEANMLQQSSDFGPNLTDWAKEPPLRDLKLDAEASRSAHSTQVTKVNKWNDILFVRGASKPKKIKGRSSVQPKLVRRQAEWRYAPLSEPFLSSKKLFTVKPATGEDRKAARQNELILNHQFRNQIDRVKFIDDYVRSTVDDGTCIIQVGWKRHTVKVKTEVPVYTHVEMTTPEQAEALQQAIMLKDANPRGYKDEIPEELKAAVDFYEENGQATVAINDGETETVEVEHVIENRPTVTIRDINNVRFDPTCEGDLDKALYAIVSFETNHAELIKEGRYKNLDKVDWESASVRGETEHKTNTPNDLSITDAMRKKIVAYEYWGFYDINDDGILMPIVVTWIGNTVIRMEESPYPDGKLPFVLVPYLPVKRELYGEPDAELLEDNQKIMGAVTRGMIDLLGKSANGQQGFAKGMLDPLNRRRFENGDDYEFNPNLTPANGLIQHKYPELPASGMVMLNLQNQEAEALTGVKSFSGGISGEAYGDMAAGARGAMDAASKREMSILRRLANGIIKVGKKFASMNAVFLSEEETVRITNETFEVINREDLKGNFDIVVDISTAEVDNSQANDLAFVLQTVGPDEDPGLRKIILADICELKRLPDLAQKILAYEPKPDPLAVKQQELMIQKLEMEIEELKSKALLNQAKAEDTSAKADLTNLDFVEQETGTKHARDLEKQRSQATGNMDLETTKALLATRKEGEKPGDIDAAIGYSQLARHTDDVTNDDEEFGAGVPFINGGSRPPSDLDQDVM